MQTRISMVLPMHIFAVVDWWEFVDMLVLSKELQPHLEIKAMNDDQSLQKIYW